MWDDRGEENQEVSLDPSLLARMTAEEFGQFLRRIRVKQRRSQHELAFEANVHPSYISFVELGKRNLRNMRSENAWRILETYGLERDTITQLFRYWGKKVPPQQRKEEPPLQRKEEAEASRRKEGPEVPEEELLKLHAVYLPIKEAGAGSPAFDDASERMLLYLPDLRGKEGEVGGIRIVGDSMEPLLYEGDIAVVWFQGGYGPGTIVAIGIPNDGIVVKQLYYDKRGYPLMHSLNPRYPDEPLPEGAKIWGPVIHIIRPMPGGVAKKRLVKP